MVVQVEAPVTKHGTWSPPWALSWMACDGIINGYEGGGSVIGDPAFAERRTPTTVARIPGET